MNIYPKQFKVSTKGYYDFHPENLQPKPQSCQLWLNSQDKIAGTNAEATFLVSIPVDFVSDRLRVKMRNFIPSYPTNTTDGIVNVNMVGVENPFSYSSSNQNTHRTLATFNFAEGRPQEYPPVALTSTATMLSNLSYGNGTYNIAQTTSSTTGGVVKAFDKEKYTSNFASSSTSSYSNQTGVYINPSSNNTTMSGTTYFGEHYTIQMPYPIILTHYDLIPPSTGFQYGTPTDFVLGGSHDNSNYTLLDTETNVQWADSNMKRFTVSNYTPFRNYRILATRVGNSNVNNFRNAFVLNEWTLWGYSNPQVSFNVPLEYPPVNMSANSNTFSNLAYGNGTYTVAGTSGVSRDPAYFIFDGNSNTSANYYSGLYGGFATASNGDYYGNVFTTMSGSNYYGSHWTLTMPNPIVPTSYNIKPHGDICKALTQWVLGGSSNNGSNWQLLDYYPQSNNVAFKTVSRPITTSQAFNMYRIVALTIGNTTCSTSFRDIPSVGEWRIYGFTNFASPISDRTGQVNLNSEIITCDKTLFKRPITLQLTSPTGTDLSTMCNWSCELAVFDDAE